MKELEYDIAIIGSGLAGCVAARTLSQNGFSSFVIIDTEANFGGTTRALPKGEAVCDFGLKQIPAIPGQEILTQEFTQIMNKLLDVRFEQRETPLVTHAKSGDGHDFQPFVGFGEKTPAEREVLDYYLQTQALAPNQPVYTWAPQLLEGIDGKLLPRSQVTRIEVENERITALIVNGDKKIHIKRVIYTGHPLGLEALLPPTVLPAKTRQRFSKTKFWTAVNLDLRHLLPIEARDGLHVLVGPGEEPRVVLGLIHNLHDGGQHSHWLTFTSSQEVDEETTASALREMKKLIQKSYPKIFDSKQEKVLVTPKSHGTLGGKNESDSALTGVKNLHITSGMLEMVPNIVGTVVRAHSATLAAIREIGRVSPTENKAAPEPILE